jgi:iron complex outermembrane receptor protein
MTLEFENALRGESYGGETVATYAPTHSWRLSASYSLLMVHVPGGPASVTGPIQFSAPQNQLVIRSSYDFTAKLSLDAQLRYVDDVRNIHSYFTGDLRLSYRVTSNLDFSVVRQNLFQSRHPEQANPLGGPTFDVPRGIYGKITWRF